jgi:hypothetical protein
VRGGTRLHPDQARRKSRKKRQHLAAPKLLPHHDLLIGVNAVDLKHVLGDIQTDQGNESRLNRLWLQRAESVQQVLRVPGGALAAALD